MSKMNDNVDLLVGRDIERRTGVSCYSKDELEQMLEDVVNVLDLGEGAIEEHGPRGTPPAELVRLVLNQKDRTIRNLRAGMRDCTPNVEHGREGE